MFTGIVQAIGTVREITSSASVAWLKIEASDFFNDAEVGESVSVNGACLTLTAVDPRGATFNAVPETLRRTNLVHLRPGAQVNLERAMRPTDRFGGHFVQGHVDGVGSVRAIERTGDAAVFTIAAPPEVTAYLVEKGSVAVNGVSLTVAGLVSGGFTLAIIPHTLATTTLKLLQPGAVVNLEADIIGKYVAQQVGRRAHSPQQADANLLRLLQEEGFAS